MQSRHTIGRANATKLLCRDLRGIFRTDWRTDPKISKGFVKTQLVTVYESIPPLARGCPCLTVHAQQLSWLCSRLPKKTAGSRNTHIHTLTLVKPRVFWEFCAFSTHLPNGLAGDSLFHCNRQQKPPSKHIHFCSTQTSTAASSFWNALTWHSSAPSLLLTLPFFLSLYLTARIVLLWSPRDFAIFSPAVVWPDTFLYSGTKPRAHMIG